MKNLIYIFVLLSLTSISLGSCSKVGLGEADQSRNPIVTVLDQTLYESDIEGLTCYGMSSKDSTAVVESFINMWITDRLIYNIAKENIPYDKIEKMVEEYRRSLIINEYQTQLLHERLSKTVSDHELLEFYNTNKEWFYLSENIIQGLYLKMPQTSPQLENFRKWYKQGTDVAVQNIDQNALQNAVSYEYFFDKWVSLDDVMDNMPKSLSKTDDFLKQNKSFETQDSTFVYFLYIKEYKLKGSEAPYDFIRDEVRNAYNETKRAEFLKELHDDLYNKAMSNKQIKFHDK